MDKGSVVILRIAVDTPLRRVFDYLPPAGDDVGEPTPRPGMRVLVPFGRRRVIGILIELAEDSPVDAAKLKRAVRILDARPVFDAVTFDLLRWAADYYHHPLGEVMAAALPASLRSGQPALVSSEVWSLTEAGRAELERASDKRAPRQRALLARLGERAQVSADELAEFKPALLRMLADRGWAAARLLDPEPAVIESNPSEVALTDAQAGIIEVIRSSLGRFAAHLLYGVTGSGKTEVYLQVIAATLAVDRQVLVLVPEIALTPQLVERFRRRFSGGVVALHSGLTGAQRRDAWRAAHGGSARIVIGTRSAVFTSMPKLALIVDRKSVV